MSTLHDIESRLACDSILDNWKSKKKDWINKLIGDDISYSNTSKNFPSPDRNFYSPSLKTRIAIEFKPFKRETKRGILTGLGQSIAYLHDKSHSASYLVIPEKIQDFQIGNFLEKIFKDKIYGKLPIGLITFKTNDPSNVKLRCQIDDNLNLIKVTKQGVDKNYWTFWRDTYPHAVYLILKISMLEKSKTNRSKLIWDKYFDDYYIPDYICNTLGDVKSKLKEWDNRFHSPLKKWKSNLLKFLKDGFDIDNNYHRQFKDFISKNDILNPSETDACNYLRNEKISKNVTDNLYQDYKKNHIISIDHLTLWNEDTKHINLFGETFVKQIDKGSNINYEFAKIILIRGRHLELINDILNIQKNMDKIPNTDEKFREKIKEKLEEKGFIKKNPNRSSSEIRKFLQSELQLWFRFGILKKNGRSFFNEDLGFYFHMDKINEIKLSYHKIYDKVEEAVLLNI